MSSWLKQILSTIATAYAWLRASAWRKKLYPGKLIRYVATETIQVKDAAPTRRIHRRRVLTESIAVGEPHMQRTATRIRVIEEAIDVVEDGTVIKTTQEW